MSSYRYTRDIPTGTRGPTGDHHLSGPPLCNKGSRVVGGHGYRDKMPTPEKCTDRSEGRCGPRPPAVPPPRRVQQTRITGSFRRSDVACNLLGIRGGVQRNPLFSRGLRAGQVSAAGVTWCHFQRWGESCIGAGKIGRFRQAKDD